MNTEVMLVHGFNVNDNGVNTTSRLIPHLEAEGLQPRQATYGHFGLVRVRLCNAAIGKVIASTVKPGAHVVGHSNGCALIWLAAKHGAQFGHVTLINPALDAGKTIDNAKSVDVWFSPSDNAVKASTILVGHIWGAQGRRGFRGIDDRYENFNQDRLWQDKVGHSGAFYFKHRRQYIAKRIAEKVKELP